jgi:hypothetical protein
VGGLLLNLQGARHKGTSGSANSKDSKMGRADQRTNDSSPTAGQSEPTQSESGSE